jgi:hypothetical protein
MKVQTRLVESLVTEGGWDAAQVVWSKNNPYGINVPRGHPSGYIYFKFSPGTGNKVKLDMKTKDNKVESFVGTPEEVASHLNQKLGL